jgi:3D-(3,5/4)-trihydroxycyclohexane-1,2-dione acylhydrolase (decyclizing)
VDRVRLTTAQAIVRFLGQQYTERDGQERRFIAGCWGIFGHGNVAGIGQALQQERCLRYLLTRNEQAMVHAAAGFARMANRLQTFACTSSIGPGATNMLTAAAGATINRLPVLLLPGDMFASRAVDPALQQLESPETPDISVNDAFRPISRFWDRIERPEQAISSLLGAMRVLTSPVETGAVTLALPEDVQAEAFDFPSALFEKRVWHVPRTRPDAQLVQRAAEWIRASRQPIVLAGGGVIYSEASDVLARLAERTGIPVAETQAGKGSLRFDHAQSLGAVGASGGLAANILARDADLVIGVGTRYGDFATASRTGFRNPAVRFVNVNVAPFDAGKQGGLPLVGDARVVLEELGAALDGFHVSAQFDARVAELRSRWTAEVERLFELGCSPRPAQSEVIGAVCAATRPRDVVVCAAGSMPGDLHKLWQTRDPKGYHVEYGYSCMGYELPGALGVKLADPSRDVFVLVGDASYLMLPSEIATAVQEGLKLTVVLVDNHGFASIGALSESVGSGGFGTRYRRRDPASDELTGEVLAVDYVANARSLGATAVGVRSIAELSEALREARAASGVSVIVIETDPSQRVPAYEAWWDVPVAEVSELASVQEARATYERLRPPRRRLL